jgi:hypothetical protein
MVKLSQFQLDLIELPLGGGDKKKSVRDHNSIFNLLQLKMEITDLSPEVQFNYLLQLSPQEILNYCEVNKQALDICNSEYFWNEKSRRDFGYVE